MAKTKPKKGEVGYRAPAKTTGYPVLTYAGLVYGTVVQPTIGGGYNSAQNSGLGGYRAGGWVEGAKQFFINLGENYTSVNFEKRQSNWKALVNGPGALAAGRVGDVAAKKLRITKAVNRLAKALKIKGRWVT